MIRIEVEGAEDIVAQLGHRKDDALKALIAGLFSAAMIVRNAAIDGIRKGPKTGRWYGRHRASAPSEYPAGDTGNLMRSIHHKVNPVALTADVEAKASYAIPLEYKAPSRGGRPFLTRAYRENVGKVVAVIRQALQNALIAGNRKARRR